MADDYLNVLAEWVADIYQIKTTDLVIGGPEGISNRQARELAARTLWLKQLVEAAATADALAAHAASRDHPLATEALRGMLPLSTLAQALAGSDDASAMSPAKVKAKIDAAIAALVDSSPAALDTLAELSAALGNDADFATTITTLLASKAALDSPAFSGTPTVPTAAPGTSTTQAASTAFVAAAVAAISLTGYAQLAVTQKFDAAQGGVILPVASGTSIILDFAAANFHSLDLAHHAVLDVPAGLPVDGTTARSGCLWIAQPPVGSCFTVSYHSVWDFSGPPPSVSMTLGAVDRLDWVIRSSGSVHAALTKGVA